MQRYLEIRTPIATSPTASADLARHLLARQHLGKTIVVCDKPVITMSVVRKYWLKLSRNLQRERSSTLNAEKILQLTYDITHMQHMEFAAKPYPEAPQADVFFVQPNQLENLPAHCFSMYMQAVPTEAHLQSAITQLPDRALVIDYSHSKTIAAAPLRPKYDLDQLVPEGWQKVEHFFREHHINITHLAAHAHRIDLIDETIDVILNTSNQFLRVTDDFLQLLQLAQPLRTSNTDQQLYDLVGLLHRRIYALTPGVLSQQFMQGTNDDELAMHDVATENMTLTLVM